MFIYFSFKTLMRDSSNLIGGQILFNISKPDKPWAKFWFLWDHKICPCILNETNIFGGGQKKLDQMELMQIELNLDF